MNEDELLQKAMAELEAETASTEAPATSAPTHQAPTSLLGKGVNVVKSVGAGMVKAGIETKDFIFGEPEEEEKWDIRKQAEQRFEELKGENVVNSVAFSVSQMVTGLVGVGKLTAPLKSVQALKNSGKAGRAAYEIGKGAAASAIVLDPHEERLSDIIEEFPALQNPVTNYLQADPSDSAAEGRFKNAIESIGLDFALVGAIKVVKLLRAGKQEEALKEIKKLEAKTGSTSPVHPNAVDDGINPQAVPKDTAVAKPDQVTNPDVDPKAAPKEDVIEQVKMGEPVGPDGQRALPSDVKEIGVHRTKEVTDEDLTAILKGSADDTAAIKKHGSVAEAVANGYKFGANTPLPWQKLRGTTETMTFIRQSAKVLRSRYDVAKGGAKLTDSRVRDLTKELGEVFNEDPTQLMGQITEMGEKASQLVPFMEASLRIGNKMFFDADKLASDIRLGNLDAFAGNAEAANMELKARIAAAVDVMSAANSMMANSGRTLRRARREFKLREADLESIKNIDPEKLAIIMEKAGGDPKKLVLLADRKWSDRVMDEASWHLTNGLLWMWPTHVINTTTNALMLVSRPTEKFFGSHAAMLLKRDPARAAELTSIARQAKLEYGYTVTSLMDGWSSMVEAFRRGDSILSPHNTEYFSGGAKGIQPEPLPWKPVKSVWDLVHNGLVSASYRNIVGLPTRSLGGMDEMFKIMRYRAVIQSRAAVEAAERGMSKVDTEAYIKRSMEAAIDPTSGRALDAKALRESQMVGFQNDLDYDVTIGGSMGRAMVSARRVAPGLNIVLPFVKTPVNVIRYGIKLSPGLNMAQKEFRDAFMGKAGEEARAHAYGQMILGSTFAGVAAVLALDGKFTGGGPSDFKVKQELLATGWKPYSYVHEGADGKKVYTQLGRFDPMGLPMGLVADIVDQMRINPDKDYSEAMGAVVIALAKNLGEKTFLLNLNNAIQAALEPEERMANWAGRTVGSMLPGSSLLRGHNPDPYMREARGFVDNMIRGVPGLSETLPKSYDVFGDPLERTVGFVGFQDSDLLEAEHNRIMLQTGKGLGKPDPKFEGVDLRDITLEDGKNAYEVLQQLSGHLPGRKSLREHLTQGISKQGYQDLPDGDAGISGTRLNYLGKLTQKYREIARKELIRKYPELKPYIKKRQRETRSAILENRDKRIKGDPGAVDLLNALSPQ